MPKYEILSRPMQFIDDYVEGGAIWYWGRHWDIIEANTPAKAKYIFYKKYLGDADFIDDMNMIEYCILYGEVDLGQWAERVRD